jgi:hypothetical protein
MQSPAAVAARLDVAAIKMYYISQVVIFCYSAEEQRVRSFDDMLESAQLAARSPRHLLAAARLLIQQSRPFEPDDMDVQDGIPALAKADAEANARRAASCVRAGEVGKAWQALDPGAFADPKDKDVRTQFAALTPQDAWVVSPDLWQDVPGQAAFQVKREFFDAILSFPLRKRAAGTLHDKYELYTAVHRFGGANALFSVFYHILADKASAEIVDMLTTLRAVVLYKDEARTRVRPIGIGETLRRLVERCVAKQEREMWAHFFTHMLPEDAAAAQELQAEAEAAVSAAAVKLQLSQAALAEAGAARLTAAATAAAEARLQQAEIDGDEARRIFAEVHEPVNYPVNYFCAANGTNMVVHTTQGWADTRPEEPILSDDKTNMLTVQAQGHSLGHALATRVWQIDSILPHPLPASLAHLPWPRRGGVRGATRAAGG